ncbi:MAG: CDP-diacylglycerol--serine O-phosphatidyltransferase [Candidatus Micrarchaeota archaeon]
MALLLKTKDYLTLANAASGFMAMFAVIAFGFIPAAFLVFLAAFFDFVDGKIARAKKESDDFGKQLDSLADAVSFCAAPAFIVSIAVLNPVVWFAALFFLMAGLIRLAKFNIQKEKHYVGLPTPIAGMALLILAIPLALVSPFLTAALILALGWLMLSKTVFKKH